MSTADISPPALSFELPPLSVSRREALALAEFRYRNLDYLRLFLAIEVIAGHLWAGLMRPGSFWIPIPPVAAFIGLSGFLIPQSLERSRNMGHFAWKRIVRTIPALVALLLVIAFTFGSKRAVGAIIQYLTAGYCGQFVGVTLPLWSLIVEDVLYVCMALLFVCGLHRRLWVTLPILAGLIIGSSYITDPMNDYRLMQTSIAFFTGNLIYIFHAWVRRIHWSIPAIAVLASLMGWLDVMGRVGFPFLIASVTVLAITLPQLKWKIPDLSYGLYIWHAPILLFLLAPIGMARDVPWIITTSALSLIAALLSWYLVEKKALKYKDVPLPPWPARRLFESWAAK